MTTTSRIVGPMDNETVDRMLRHFDSLEDATLALNRRLKLAEESLADWQVIANTAMEAMEAAVAREDAAKKLLSRMFLAFSINDDQDEALANEAAAFLNQGVK